MKIVKFKGGLGNQLFQYAFVRLLQLQYGCESVKADFSYFEFIKNDNVRKPRIEDLNIIIEKASTKELKEVLLFSNNSIPHSFLSKFIIFVEKFLNSKYYFEKSREYINPENLLKYTYFDGYWQSWKYIEKIKEILNSELIPKLALNDNTMRTIEKIGRENTVFLGIRRGDYLESRKHRRHYGSYSQEYFNKAFDIIKAKVNNPTIYVFSNDIEWVKKNIEIPIKCIYREQKDQVSDLDELILMSSCKHAIIVNSTFYWWGAWLIQNDDKVIIAPRKWFADNSKIDLIPDSWIKI